MKNSSIKVKSVKSGFAWFIAIAVLLTSACTMAPNQSTDQSVEMTDNTRQTAETQKGEQESAETSAEDSAPERPKIELTEDILFKLLVAEIAGQRNQLDISVENYLDLHCLLVGLPGLLFLHVMMLRQEKPLICGRK